MDTISGRQSSEAQCRCQSCFLNSTLPEPWARDGCISVRSLTFCHEDRATANHERPRCSDLFLRTLFTTAYALERYILGSDFLRDIFVGYRVSFFGCSEDRRFVVRLETQTARFASAMTTIYLILRSCNNLSPRFHLHGSRTIE